MNRFTIILLLVVSISVNSSAHGQLFSNYDVNSECDLAYLIQSNIKEIKSPFRADPLEIERINSEMAEQSRQYVEKYGPDIEQNKKILDEANSKVLDHIIEYNSINPKLRDSVLIVLDDPFHNPEVLGIMFLIEPIQYENDLECGKKFHEEFGSETFNTLKQIYGEDAQSKYQRIKNIIYSENSENDSNANLDEISANQESIESNIYEQTKIDPEPSTDGGGGCLIATATYGSELAPQVQQLRELRDNTLLSTQSGKSFMTGFNNFYYSFSPIIADLERENPIFKETVKIAITPMLSTLSIMTLAEDNSEVEVLGLGLSIIALNIGMYFVAPGIIIHTIRKKF